MSLIRKLVSHFDQKGRSLYIKTEEIERVVLSLSYGHEVAYCAHRPKRGTKALLLGMLEQVEARRAWGDGVDNFIHYNELLPENLKRLVIAKELIHIIDPNCYLTNTPTLVRDLMSALAAPSAVKRQGSHCFHDHSTVVILAVGLFLPLSVREELLAAHESGILSDAAIAESVGIPAPWVTVVMHKVWPQIFSHAVTIFEEEILD